MKKRMIFLSLIIGLALFLIFKNMCFSCLFMPREFTGEIDGLFIGSEIDIPVRQPDGQTKGVILAMVSDPLPRDRDLPGAVREILDLSAQAYNENKTVRVKIIKWKKENVGVGLLYIDDQDLALLLLREGYLIVDPDSKVKVDAKTLSAYKEAERLAKKEKKGVWKLEECLD